MANLVILGVYSTKTALDTAELASASNGDTYIVGSKSPYDLYTYSSSKTAFQKGEKVGRVGDLDISINDVTESIAFSDILGKTIKDSKNRDVKLIQAVGKGLELYELTGA